MLRGILLPLGLIAVSAVLLWSCTVEPVAAERLKRGSFFVEIEELLENRKTKELEKTDINVAELLITRKLVHHGFEPVSERSKARYVIEGKLEAKFLKVLNFEFQGQKTLLEHQYTVEMLCSLTDTQEKGEPERFDIPHMINGRNKDAAARLDIRRRPATAVAGRMVQGKTLGKPDIIEEMRSLGYVTETKTFNEVVKSLAAHGLAVVPFMIEMLYDERPVKLSGEYPDLEEWNKDSLRYYHIADMVLTDVLDRDSALKLDSSDVYVRNVRVGWTWVWEDVQGIPAKYRERESDRKSSVKASEDIDTGQDPPPIPDGSDGGSADAKGDGAAGTPKAPTTTQPKKQEPRIGS